MLRLTKHRRDNDDSRRIRRQSHFLRQCGQAVPLTAIHDLPFKIGCLWFTLANETDIALM